MKAIISLTNNKGGVGKTTSSQNLAAGLAKFAESKILAIDADSQGNLTKVYGIDPNSVQHTTGDFILGRCTLQDAIINKGNVSILPANISLSDKIESIQKSSSYPYNLKKVLKKHENDFDYVIIDCAPSLKEGLTKLALIASTHYFVPMEAKFLSYEGLRNLFLYTQDITETFGVKLGGVFPTKFNPRERRKMSRDLVNTCKEQLGDMLMSTNIRNDVKLDEAQSEGMDIFAYNANCNGAEDYYNFTKEVLNRIV